jgi:hypothetical protein
MVTLISQSADGAIDRFERLAAGFGAGAGRAVLLSHLTSRDIQAEALARLARLGYDWSGTPGKRRRAP